MPNALQIPVPSGNPAGLVWNGRSAPGISTLLLINQDLDNTVYVGNDPSITVDGQNVIPIQPNGTMGVDPASSWYVIGAVAGILPLVMVPNGQNSFRGVSNGQGSLAIPAIHSPNYDPIAGTGWTINKDGSASFNEVTIVITSDGVALLIYFPAPGLGNLIGSWAASETVDQFGNDVPAGINVNGGVLNAVTMNAPSIIGGVIEQILMDASTITNSNMVGGTILETTITFDSTGGLLIGYATTTSTTTVTQTANGTYSQTLPPGVTSIINAQVWAAGTGGDGGNTSEGGNGGAGGEFAGESIYTPSQNPFSYVVGNGGAGSSTGNGHGTDGGDSFIDNGGVFANGGSNATGGSGSTNTIHHNGGNGGAASGNGGGASGGNSGAPTAAGNNGIASTSNTGGNRPTAQTNAGQGGVGGSASGNGGSSSAPGAGGGGAGQGTSSGGTLTKTYTPTWTGSYIGPDGGTPNAGRSNTVMYQGGETSGGGSFNGNQRWAAAFNRAAIASDFSGYTITACQITVTNQHTWYNSGMTFQVDEFAGLGGSAPGSYPAAQYLRTVSQGTIGEGTTHTYSLGAALGQRFATGTTNGLGMGNQIAATQPYNLNYYGFFTGGSAFKLTITGTKTVTGSTSAGNGQDGKISFQYQQSSTAAMVFALSAVAGTDINGNAFAAGYTGPVNAIQPGSSPAVVETWHNMTLINGWTVGGGGIAQYKLNPDNTVSLRMANVVPGTVTSGTAIWNIPSGYFNPSWSGTQNFVVGTTVSSSVANNNTPFLAARANGTLTVQSLPANLSNIFVNAVRYPLD